MSRLLMMLAIASGVFAWHLGYARDTAIYNGKLTSDMDANDFIIKNLAEPTNDNDAANKSYVDGKAVDLSPAIDYTTAVSNKLEQEIADIPLPPVNSVNGRTGDVVIGASDVWKAVTNAQGAVDSREVKIGVLNEPENPQSPLIGFLKVGSGLNAGLEVGNTELYSVSAGQAGGLIHDIARAVASAIRTNAQGVAYASRFSFATPVVEGSVNTIFDIGKGSGNGGELNIGRGFYGILNIGSIGAWSIKGGDTVLLEDMSDGMGGLLWDWHVSELAAIAGKQDKLTAGANITIDTNNVISATGSSIARKVNVAVVEGVAAVSVTNDCIYSFSHPCGSALQVAIDTSHLDFADGKVYDFDMWINFTDVHTATETTYWIAGTNAVTETVNTYALPIAVWDNKISFVSGVPDLTVFGEYRFHCRATSSSSVELTQTFPTISNKVSLPFRLSLLNEKITDIAANGYVRLFSRFGGNPPTNPGVPEGNDMGLFWSAVFVGSIDDGVIVSIPHMSGPASTSNIIGIAAANVKYYNESTNWVYHPRTTGRTISAYIPARARANSQVIGRKIAFCCSQWMDRMGNWVYPFCIYERKANELEEAAYSQGWRP